jgi:hypothetical protein
MLRILCLHLYLHMCLGVGVSAQTAQALRHHRQRGQRGQRVCLVRHAALNAQLLVGVYLLCILVVDTHGHLTVMGV